MRISLLTATLACFLLAAPAGADLPETEPAAEVTLSRTPGEVHFTLNVKNGEPLDRPVLRFVTLPAGASGATVPNPGESAVEIDLGEPMILRGTTVLPVTVRPRTGAAGKSGTGPVEFDILYNISPSKTVSSGAGASSRGFFDSYGSLFAAEDLAALASDDEGSYLIITDPLFVSAVEPFAEWKREIGFDVIVATTAQTGMRNDEIQAYIKNLYDHSDSPPQYVLLVGDVEQIAAWDYHQSISDLPYALMDGDDFLPDLEVGRFSASTLDDANTIIAKNLRYERDPYRENTDWFGRALLVAGNYSSKTPVPVSRWCREQLYDIGFAEVDTVFYPPWWSLNPPIPPFIHNSIDAGVSIVSYRGWAYGWRGWEPPYFTVDEIPALRNGWMTPLVCSFVCLNTNFAEPECFGEAWIRAGTATEPKGAVAFIGNSEPWSHTRGNDAAAIGFFKELNGGGRRLGRLLTGSRTEIHRSFPDQIEYEIWEDNAVEFYYYIYSLLGDPAMEIWTAPPVELTVNHPDTIALGGSYYWLEVLDEETEDPIEDARVSLTQDSELLGCGFTDHNGTARIIASFDDDSAPVKITVTGTGLLPWQETVPVVSSGRTHLTYDDVQIRDDGAGRSSGNGDGVVNPGEVLEVRVGLKNNDSENATDVSGALNIAGTLQPFSVEYALVSSPDIAAGGSAWSDTTWLVTIDGDVDDGRVARFQLNAFTSGTETMNGFELEVKAPDLTFAAYTIDGDGIVDPGESVSLGVTVINDGSVGATASSAVLRSETPGLLSVTASVSGFGALIPGESGAATVGFTIEATDSAAVGQAGVLSLETTTSEGYVMITSFSVPIGEADHSAPLGPDTYGYYAYDNSDTDYPDGTPLFDWSPISTAYGGDGTKLDLVDNDLTVVPLPFPFTFYGKSYTRLLVSDNGWVSFDTTSYYDFYNWSMPNTYGNGAQLAVFWDNLDPTKDHEGSPVGDGIYVWSDTEAERFVVEWSRLGNLRPYHGNREDYDELQTFQLILHDPVRYPTDSGDGIIRYQYKHVVNNDWERMYATVGIENETEDDGIEYTYTNMYPAGAAPLSSGLAIEFSTKKPKYVPFALKQFSALPADGGLILAWEPADERPRGMTVVYKRGGDGEYRALPNGLLPADARTFLDESADPSEPTSYKIGSFDPVGAETVLGPYEHPGKTGPALKLALGLEGPNPFRGGAILRYALPEKKAASLRIYTVSGRLVRTLFDGETDAGIRTAEWDGRDNDGREVPSGVYLGRLEVGTEQRGVKLTLLR